MGLLQKACETYDNCLYLVGKVQGNGDPLAPCSHIATRADLEITVDQDGQFIKADAVDKSEPKIVIPATEDSAGRTSGACAHPLCDQLQYLAPCGGKRHMKYLQQLRAWEGSAYSHPKLRPILRYVEGGTILSDLQRAGKVELDESGVPKNEKLLVRWYVVGLGEDSGPCWTDTALFQAFDAYYRAKKSKDASQLCMVTGEETEPATQHLKGIDPFNGNAKLISSNDSENFTYRGRFSEPWQAATVGYTASQKAHNALRWLLSNQGVSFGKRTFLCWSPQGIRLPSPGRPFLYGEIEEQPADPSNYQRQLWKVLSGWKESLPKENAEAVIAVFDAATNGRLSLTYYNQLQASDFLDRLYDWDRICCWTNRWGKLQSPWLKEVVDCTFGTLHKEKNGAELVTDKKILRQQMQRLLHCRVDRATMPPDIARILVQRVSTPQAFDEETWERILFTACAVIRKYNYDTKREEYKMALEPQKRDRSYQYGRLLAVLEKAEKDTYDKEGSRETNAMRLLSVFAQRPQYAGRIIWEQVKTAYYPRLKPSAQAYYDGLIGEIWDVISTFPENELNRPLEDSYPAGYSLQRKALYTKKEKNTEDEENDGFTE